VGSTRIWKTSTRLADGREIIYYDETPDTGRADVTETLDVMSPQRAAGRLKFLASTEAGAGVWSNDVLPENAARTIREAMR
jgi:galactose-1-phosphate uridylyltransferase